MAEPTRIEAGPYPIRHHLPSETRATTPAGMPEGDDYNLSSARVVVDVIPDP